jgi:hypothetical protein
VLRPASRLSASWRDARVTDAEAAIFYALALNGAVDFTDKNYTKQHKAAAILNEQAKAQPNLW